MVFQTSPSTSRTKKTEMEATFARAVKGAQRKIIKIQSQKMLKVKKFGEKIQT